MCVCISRIGGLGLEFVVAFFVLCRVGPGYVISAYIAHRQRQMYTCTTGSQWIDSRQNPRAERKSAGSNNTDPTFARLLKQPRLFV